jgi:hypothetical protein
MMRRLQCGGLTLTNIKSPILHFITKCPQPLRKILLQPIKCLMSSSRPEGRQCYYTDVQICTRLLLLVVTCRRSPPPSPSIFLILSLASNVFVHLTCLLPAAMSLIKILWAVRGGSYCWSDASVDAVELLSFRRCRAA